MVRLLQVRQLKYKQGSKAYQYLGISLQVPSVGDRIEAGFPDCLDFVENSIFTRFSGFHFSIISTSCKRPL